MNIPEALRALKEATPAAGSMHQHLSRIDPEYALDAEMHGPDCVQRFDEEHEDCLNGDQCRVGEDVLHECGFPEHFT